MGIWLRFITLLSMLVASSVGAVAQPSPDGWQKAVSIRLLPQSDRTSISLEHFADRAFGLKFAIGTGKLDIRRVVISYGNGEQLPEDKSFQISGNRASPVLGERSTGQGGLVIDRIDIIHEKLAAAATIDVLIQTRPRTGGNASRGVISASGYQEVEVLFGTSRQQDGERPKGARSLATFGSKDGTELTRGRALVTIPKNYKSGGEIPRPSAVDLVLFKFNLRAEDPNRDFTIAAVDVLTANAFAQRVGNAAQSAKMFKRQAFVFIHGYNSSFEDAIFRAAQITSDLGFDGAPIVFSWQSKAGLLDYFHDQAVVGAAKLHLFTLLREIAANPSVDQINIIAHSMGNEVLLRALTEEVRDQSRSLKLGELILAAPDVDRAAFSQLVERLRPLAKGITLYASASDRALELSSKLVGRPRAGQVPPGVGPILVGGVDTIDVSDASTEFFAVRHTEFADRRHLLHDMGVLFRQSIRPPDARSSYVFAPITKGRDTYWRYLRN